MNTGGSANSLWRSATLLAIYGGGLLATGAADTNAPAPANLPSPAAQLHQRWILLGFIACLLFIAVVYRSRRAVAQTAR